MTSLRPTTRPPCDTAAARTAGHDTQSPVVVDLDGLDAATVVTCTDRLDDLRPLFYTSFYDLPLVAYGWWDGRLVELVLIGHDDGLFANPLVYAVVDLDPDRARTVRVRHAAFRRHVGTHTQLAAPGRGVVHPRESHAAFYDDPSLPEVPARSRGPLLGWVPTVRTAAPSPIDLDDPDDLPT